MVTSAEPRPASPRVARPTPEVLLEDGVDNQLLH
jgi:hypothetical protein